MAGAKPRDGPDILQELTGLALDLFWTWSHCGDALWSRLAPEIWAHTHNPWIILQAMSSTRLQELAGDESFRRELDALTRERRTYLATPGWFEGQEEHQALGPIALFSMEFGLSDALPLYAGGLGVLAGDTLKTASDLGVPVIGVGLLYQEGYFRQFLNAAGQQEEAWPYNEPASMPICPARDKEGEWLRIPLDLPGRTILLRVWEATLGRTRLYLLDSNEPMNTASDRGVTAKLYGGTPTIRFLQEVALGIGGWRALEALGIAPDICHLNEGHTAFAALERAASAMRRLGLDFDTALWATRAGNVFTTHTPVAAGFDRYDPRLLMQHFLGAEGLYGDIGLEAEALLALGRHNGNDPGEPFNMAWLATRLSARINGVSRLHGAVSRRLFSGLFPRWPEDEVPVGHITNGVHMPSWDSAAADALWTATCGKERWRVGRSGDCEEVCHASDEALWSMRADQRKALVEFVRHELYHQLRLRKPWSGAPPEIERILDPNALTLGFGRRFTAYKRPELLLTDPDRLARLLSAADRPVQLVIAGKAHPEDADGKESIARWAAFVGREDVRRHAVFLEDYDIGIARHLIEGVDVWITMPRRTREACGTSGMKVLVNGGLNLSSRDGWWDEACAPDAGWTFGGIDPDDAADAEALYRILETEIAPEFYDCDAAGLPRRWIARMRASMSRLAAQFCSNRMLLDYVRDCYRPAAQDVRRRLADDATLAHALRRRERTLRSHWDQLHFGRHEARETESGLHVSVYVQLGEIDPDMVTVELTAEPSEGAPRPVHVMERGAATPGAVHGYEYHCDIVGGRPAGHFTPRIVPARSAGALPSELPLVLWQR